VRQPRKRWGSHRRVAGCAAIAAVVTSGVSHRFFAVWRNLATGTSPVGAAGAVRQPRKRWGSHRRVAGCAAIAAVVTSGVSHRLCSAAKSRDWHETCGSCWSRATAAKALGQSQLGRRMYRYRCRRDLRRLPQVLQRDEISRLARDLWEQLELCDSRESIGSVIVEWPDVPLSLPS
jgi:hypothetical protein